MALKEIQMSVQKSLFVLLASFLFLRVSHATVVMKVDPEALAANADVIFAGKVVDIKTFSNKEDEKRIFTSVLFDVKEVFKGSLKKGLFRLTFLGGKKGKWELKVIGMPVFQVGEELLLFLEKNSDGYIPSALSLGKFRFVKDNQGKIKAVRSYEGIAPFSGEGLLQQNQPLEEFDLDRLIDIIKATVKSGIMK